MSVPWLVTGIALLLAGSYFSGTCVGWLVDTGRRHGWSRVGFELFLVALGVLTVAGGLAIIIFETGGLE